LADLGSAASSSQQDMNSFLAAQPESSDALSSDPAWDGPDLYRDLATAQTRHGRREAALDEGRSVPTAATDPAALSQYFARAAADEDADASDEE
jgi:hypothetical protein